jgi:hypothetical protein
MFLTHPLTSPHAAGIPYALPMTVLDVVVEVTLPEEAAKKATREPSDFGITFTVTAIPVPDPSATFVLDHARSFWSSDEFTVTTTEGGLLTGVTFTGEDQSLQVAQAGVTVLVNLAKTAAEIQTGGLGLMGRAAARAGAAPSSAAVVKLLESLLGKHEIVYGVRDLLRADAVRFDLPQDAGRIDVALEPLFTRPDGERDHGSDGTTLPEGIRVRLGEPYRLRTKLVLGRGANAIPFAEADAYALLPDASPVVSIPFDRASLVKTVRTLAFANGKVTSVTANIPSGGLAIATALRDVTAAIAAVPTDVVKARIEMTKQQESLAQESGQLQALKKAEQRCAIQCQATLFDCVGKCTPDAPKCQLTCAQVAKACRATCAAGGAFATSTSSSSSSDDSGDSGDGS